MPIAGAALVCSAALAALRIWPSDLSIADLTQPSPDLLFNYQSPGQSPRTPPTASMAAGPRSQPVASDLFEEFAAEGFHFTPPSDYWERSAAAASPFVLLQPAFSLRRTESSPPSSFGVGSCDFAVSTHLLPDGCGIDQNWENLPCILGVQAMFACGLPARYEVSTGSSPPLHCLRLVWPALPATGASPPRRLEMWVHQNERVAWAMTCLMPGSNASYALSRTMQRLTSGFSLLGQNPPTLQVSLAGRDTEGSVLLLHPAPPHPLFRWKSLPTGTTTWPGGRTLAPGAESTYAVGDSRMALAVLPPQGLEKATDHQILTALRQLWPALRPVTISFPDDNQTPEGQPLRLTLPATLTGSPAICELLLSRSTLGIVVALVLNPETSSAPVRLSDVLDPAVQPQIPFPPAPASTLHLPLLQTLATEAHANGRLQECAAFQLAVFSSSQKIDDLATACLSLANSGQKDTATVLFESGGQAFANTPGWELYRTLMLARLGAGATAHRQAMDLLSAQRFPGSLATPYLDALFESECWPQARAFASLLIRTDPDSPMWRLQYARIVARTGDLAKAVSIIRATRESWPDDALLGVECVQNLMSLNALQEAAATASDVALSHPGNEQVQLMRGQCQLMLGKTDEARLAFLLALRASPASPAARASLAALTSTHGQADSAFISPSIDPVPLPVSLADALPAPPAEFSGPALVLSRITGIRHQQGRPSATTVRSRVLVTNAEGMSQWNTLTLPVQPSRQRLTLHHLNVTDSGGRLISSANPADRYSLDAPDGSKRVHFPVQGLTPGCVIDYAVTTESTAPAESWPFLRHRFSTASPCLADICYVTGNTGTLTWQHSGGREPVRSGETLIWREDRPALPGTPPSADVPTLCLGTVTGSWESVGRSYLEQIRHRLTPDDTVSALAARTIEGTRDRAGKVAALARRVRSDVSYTAIEFGSRAIIPHSAADTLRNRYGDCKDHAVLLHSLLTAAGIPSNLALIPSREPLNPSFPSLEQFDHMIVALPAGKDRFDFIDATDKFLEPVPGTAPNGLESAQALILDPASPHLAATPDRLPPSTGTIARIVTVNSAPDALVEDRLSLTGPAAATLRAALSPLSPAEQLPALRRLLGLDRLQEQLLKAELSALRDPSLPLEAHLTWQSRNAIRNTSSGRQLTLSSPLCEYLMFPVAGSWPETGTASSLVIQTPMELSLTVEIKTPEGWTATPPTPAPARKAGPAGTWSGRITGRTLDWNLRLEAGQFHGGEAAAGSGLPLDAMEFLHRPWIITALPPFISTPSR